MEIETELRAIAQERIRIAEAEAALQERTRAAVAELRRRGWVVRRVAAAVGLSPARIGQMDQQS